MTIGGKRVILWIYRWARFQDGLHLLTGWSRNSSLRHEDTVVEIYPCRVREPKSLSLDCLFVNGFGVRHVMNVTCSQATAHARMTTEYMCTLVHT